jgi:predicted O-methyltransferase YrrM
MDEAVRRVFADYDQHFAAEAAGRPGGGPVAMEDRSLPIGPEAGALLALLVKAVKAKHILELGTSNGYSTLWLAEAAHAVGGKVTTIEERRPKQDYARAALTKAGLASAVEFLAGDALDILKTLPGPFDFVLLDLWKDLYVPCLDLFYPKLAPGAMIVADNMIQPASSRNEAHAYRRAVRAKPKMQSMLLQVGQGLELSRYVGELPADLV